MHERCERTTDACQLRRCRGKVGDESGTKSKRPEREKAPQTNVVSAAARDEVEQRESGEANENQHDGQSEYMAHDLNEIRGLGSSTLSRKTYLTGESHRIGPSTLVATCRDSVSIRGCSTMVVSRAIVVAPQKWI
jgi:hypothetical protein